MSSIDKYVEGEARSCNPRVQVRKEFGRIKGYIGTTKVFDIADREGYLSEREKSIIHSGIRAYELQDEEYRRREAIRVENERIAVRTELKQNVNTARQALNTAYRSAMQSYSAVANNLNFSASISKHQGYNLNAYKTKALQLEQRVRNGLSAIESDYQTKLQRLNDFEADIDDSASTQVYAQQGKSLRQLSTNISGVTIPVEEIGQMRLEIEKLEEALTKVSGIEIELKKIPNQGLSGSLAHNAIEAIHNQSIGSLQDMDQLMSRVQEQLAKIREVEFHQKTADRSDTIAKLDGIVKSCSVVRSYVVEQHYEAATYRSEIVHAANRVLNAYTELRNAKYTTCDQEKMENACSIAQGILIGKESDERVLRDLERLLDQYEVYKRDDLLQADNYADYCSKVEELTMRGMLLSEIEAFDPHAYEKQKKRLLKSLLEQDVQETISKTRTTFLMACKAMEDMGYVMLQYDMGNEEKEVEGVNDALACEATYVIPGCEGVVWRLFASDCNVSRKLVGVVRPDGRATPVETVRAVAKKVEDNGEINEFFSRYSEACGTELTVLEAVDTDTEGSDEVIANNSFSLAAEGEAYFDKLVSSGDAAARQKWKTAVPKNATVVVTVTDKKESDRRSECSNCHQRIQAKRKK